MSTTTPSQSVHGPDDRLLELLADRTLGELDAADQAELDRLLASGGGSATPAEEFDYAAAAATVALFESSGAVDEPAPESVRRRLDIAASAWTAARSAERAGRAEPAGATGGREFGAPPSPTTPVSIAPSAPVARRASLAPALGWLAAAACLAIAIFAWVDAGEAPIGPASPAAELAQLRAAPGVVETSWTKGPSEEYVADLLEGDVVWSPTEQRGFMTFRGLKPNDPSVEQYQLWIFDATRDEAHPVDGGVFDIAADGEAQIVPIDPRVPVGEATLFAVTVERPGGVVVSDRSKLPVLAPIGS